MKVSCFMSLECFVCYKINPVANIFCVMNVDLGKRENFKGTVIYQMPYPPLIGSNIS